MQENTKNYGTKADGSPRQKPGRKSTGETLKTFYVIADSEGVMRQNYSKGRPSLETLKNRRRVTINKNDEYNPDIHGTGEVVASDLVEIARLEIASAKKSITKRVNKPLVKNLSSVVVETLDPV